MGNFYLTILTDIKFENDLLNGNVLHITRDLTLTNLSPFSSAITVTTTTTFYWDRPDLSVATNHIIFVGRNRIPPILSYSYT